MSAGGSAQYLQRQYCWRLGGYVQPCGRPSKEIQARVLVDHETQRQTLATIQP